MWKLGTLILRASSQITHLRKSTLCTPPSCSVEHMKVPVLLSDGAQWYVRFPTETRLPTFNVLCHMIFYPRSCYFWIPGSLTCPCWKNKAVALTSLKLVLLSTFWNRLCRYLTLREPKILNHQSSPATLTDNMLTHV